MEERNINELNESRREQALPLINQERKEQNGGFNRMSILTFNYSNSAIGSGMMALPYFVASIGLFIWYLFNLILIAVTITSISIIAKATTQTRKYTYPEIVNVFHGIYICNVMRFLFITTLIGSLSSYIIIIADILVGYPGYDGLIPMIMDYFNFNTEVWYCSRWFIIIIVICFIIQPMILLKSMKSFSKTSFTAIMFALILALISFIISIISGIRNNNVDIILWPNITGSDIFTIIFYNITVLGTFLTAYSALNSVPVTIGDSKVNDSNSIMKYFILANVICFCVYALLSTSASITFGSDVQEDVLLNFSIYNLSKIINSNLAIIFGGLISVLYLLKLIFIFPVNFLILRDIVSEALFQKARLNGWKFYFVTYLILGCAVALSIVIGSIKIITSILGCVTLNVDVLIYPSILLWQKNTQKKLTIYILSCFLLFMGIVILISGLYIIF